MKRLNKKGFTLIELLAVIVVLAIILVISVPMILNTIGDTKKSSLDASAKTVADYYRNQISLASLNKSESTIIKNNVKFDNDGKLCVSGATLTAAGACSTTTPSAIDISSEFSLLGLDSTEYKSGVDGSSVPYSSVQWDANGSVTVKLTGADDGNFAGLSSIETK